MSEEAKSVPSSVILVSIIGSANRNKEPWTLETYQNMKNLVRSILEENKLLELPSMTLILQSGGAAWSDFVAVDLFLDLIRTERPAQLLLQLPAKWDAEHKCFVSKTRDGFTSNKYHEWFTKQTNIQSLELMHQAMAHPMCLVMTHDGFQARNKWVANCQHLIAISVAPAAFHDHWKVTPPAHPITSGTLQTWKMCDTRVKKHHVIAYF